jgi:hypothetical protein
MHTTGPRHRSRPAPGFRQGNALVEFAFVAPVLIAMMISLVQLSQVMQVRKKMAETGSFLGAGVTAVDMTQTRIRHLCAASFRTLFPFSADLAQITLTCAFRNGSGAPSIAWQITRTGSRMPAAQPSRIGAMGASPTFPGSFALLPAQSVIVVEVFYWFVPVVESPWFGPLQAQALYTVSFHLPCTGRMVTLAQGGASGVVVDHALEASGVDLAAEFTDMIERWPCNFGQSVK